MKQSRKSKTYKRKTTKNGKSRRNKMKGGSCGCNNTQVMTGGLANSPYYYALNTHNVDPNAPAAIIDSRLQPILPVTKLSGGKKIRKSKKMKGGSSDLTSIFSKVATPFFPVSNYMNPIVSTGTTAGAITSNVILTGNGSVTNQSQVVPSNNNVAGYLV
jgi:hypothetical protein